MNIMANKATLGELTLGELWDSLKSEVYSVLVVDAGGTSWGPYENFSIVPRVSLELSRKHGQDWDSEFAFDLGSKVSVREDHVEFVVEDMIGDKESISLYFLHRPQPEPIKLDFLLPGVGE